MFQRQVASGEGARARWASGATKTGARRAMYLWDCQGFRYWPFPTGFGSGKFQTITSKKDAAKDSNKNLQIRTHREYWLSYHGAFPAQSTQMLSYEPWSGGTRVDIIKDFLLTNPLIFTKLSKNTFFSKWHLLHLREGNSFGQFRLLLLVLYGLLLNLLPSNRALLGYHDPTFLMFYDKFWTFVRV